MTDAKKILSLLNSIKPTECIGKKDRQALHDGLEDVYSTLRNKEDKKLMKSVVDKLSKGSIHQNSKIYIINNKTKITKIVNIYGEQYNKKSNKDKLESSVEESDTEENVTEESESEEESEENNVEESSEETKPVKLGKKKVEESDTESSEEAKPVKLGKKKVVTSSEKSTKKPVVENITFEEAEKKADSRVSYYDFSDTNPMKYVTYDKSNNKFRLYKKGVVSTRFGTKKEACEKMKDMIEQWQQTSLSLRIDAKNKKKSKNNPKIIFYNEASENITKKFFLYGDYYHIVYIIDNIKYFDIQHIISSLNLVPDFSKQKYNTFAELICKFMWFKNEFNGYILRELITLEGLCKILMSSESALSKRFKNDIAGIMAELDNEGRIEITNKKMSLCDQTNNKKINELVDAVKFAPFSYESKEHLARIYSTLTNLSLRPFAKYLNTSVLYIFIVPLKRDHNNIVVKIGWTCDILKRWKQLASEYHSNFYLLDIKKIEKESVETEFHEALKKRYPDAIELMTIKKQEKTELYKFNDQILQEFRAVKEDPKIDVATVITDPSKMKLDDWQRETIDIISQQHIIFSDIIMSQIDGADMIDKLKSPECQKYHTDLHFSYLIRHSEKSQEVALEKIKLERAKIKSDQEKEKMKLDHELELAKINRDVEIARIKSTDAEKQREHEKYMANLKSKSSATKAKR